MLAKLKVLMLVFNSVNFNNCLNLILSKSTSGLGFTKGLKS